MRKPIFPITVWALKRGSMYLISYCSSLAEAIHYAKQFPFTPLVFTATGEIPCVEQHVSSLEFGEATGY